MTRVLFWNVENFNLATIRNPSSAAATLQSGDRLTVIRDILQTPPPFGHAPDVTQTPDLILIAECSSRNREVGSEGGLIAADGVMLLLTELRTATANPNWSLVPPVRLGQFGHQEGVAAFYNANNLMFAGPYVWGVDYRTLSRTAPLMRACPWADSQRPPSAPIALPNGPQDYPDAWNNCMPARNLPAAFPILGGVSERQLAGQWEHYTVGAKPERLEFPHAFSRSPYFTQFIDLAGGNRLLKVYTVHTSPNVARTTTAKLGDLPEVGAGQAANSVTLVVGDFNLDIFEARAAGYQPLLDAGFTILLDSRDAAGNLDPARRPYLTTHLLPATKATPFNGPATDVLHNPAPRLGYMGSMGGRDFQRPTYVGAIDNALVRYPAGVAHPAHETTVLNPVVGSPYAGPANMPRGTVAKASAMAAALPAAGYPDPTAAEPGTFQLWQNFEKIHSASDHLAISMVI